MSTNMELITSVTVGSGGAASVTLPATGTIPATYTDLKVVASVRTEGTGSPYLYLRFNGSSTGYSNRRIIGDGSAASSSAPSDAYIIGGICNTTDQTTSTFSSHDIYIPNYAGSNNKSVSVDAVTENNATSARAIMLASLWSNSAAITSIVLTNEAAVDFAEGSTFYLYGISNVTSTTKATGGIVSSDGTYNYHMFPYSGTFTPTTNLTADYLVIAGGGGGGKDWAGGGGAGGLRSTVGTTGGGGSLESAISLTANTAYSVTVGGGGAGATASGTGTAGSNSILSGSGITTITSTGGGGGASPSTNGATGGSGGGGGYGATSGGAGTTNQGYAGGNSSGNEAAGGGGGSGTVGSAGVSGTKTSGAGGVGVQITAIANATQTGVNTYYAGGGGGGAGNAGVRGLGNSGGGNGGFPDNTVGSAGITNTGSGGGGGGGNGANGGAGGSGLVVIRYAI